MFSKFKKKSMLLLSFMSSLKCCKNFPLKINFSESTLFGSLCCCALYFTLSSDISSHQVIFQDPEKFHFCAIHFVWERKSAKVLVYIYIPHQLEFVHR